MQDMKIFELFLSVFGVSRLGMPTLPVPSIRRAPRGCMGKKPTQLRLFAGRGGILH